MWKASIFQPSFVKRWQVFLLGTLPKLSIEQHTGLQNSEAGRRMKTVRIAYSRIYNAKGCSFLGHDECLLKFPLGTIKVEANIGPRLGHLVLAFKSGPERLTDPKAQKSVSREQEYQDPPPDKFPADVYKELNASQYIEVSDELFEAFQCKEAAARSEILRRAKENKAALTSALNFVAGVLGFRLHFLLVRVPITEQWYAYRDQSTSYALEGSLQLKALEACKCDLSDEAMPAIRSKIPQLQTTWTWKKAGSVLAWLLRAWSAEDPILEFVSLFVPLERIIPESPQESNESSWDQKKSALLAIIEKETEIQNRDDLSKFVANLRPPPPPLTLRFEKWAAAKALPGWEKDIEAFKRFQRMRNLLVHAGKSDMAFRVTVEANDVRTLEDITERYVSLALFGDANVYQSPKRSPQQ